MDIDSKFQPNFFYLKIYKMATPYFFRFQDSTSSQKISMINKKITKNNVENRKSKLDYLIPLESIMQTIN